MNEKIEMTEISPVQITEFKVDSKPTIRLGSEFDPEAAESEQKLNSLLDKLKDQAERFFIIEWEGSKVLRDVNFQDQQIAGMQNGMIISISGETLGYYERIVEYGGDSGQKQLVLVYT